MKVHHTITKKAEANGLLIEQDTDSGEFFFHDAEHVNWGHSLNPKTGLKMALVNMENNTPYDTDGAIGEDMPDDADDNSKSTMIPEKYRETYALNDDSCGDEMAKALKEQTVVEVENGKGKKKSALSLGALTKIAKQNGIDIERYEHLNSGQIRMNVGNRLRGLLRKGTDVVIGSVNFKGEAQEQEAAE